MFLPNEVWSKILRSLNGMDLLRARMISIQVNNLSCHFLKERKFQVTIRNDNEIVEFSRLFPNCTTLFHEYVNINFVLHPISSEILEDYIKKLSTYLVQCTLNIQIEQPVNDDIDLMGEKLKLILTGLKNLRSLEIIADKKTRVLRLYIPQMLQLEKLCLNIRHLFCGFDEPQLITDSLFEAATNLKTLIFKRLLHNPRDRTIIPPLSNSSQLKEIFIQKSPYRSIFKYFERETLENCLIKSSTLEKVQVDCNFEMEAIDYVTFVQHMKFGSYCFFDFNPLLTTARFNSIELDISGIRQEESDSIRRFLHSQMENLKFLKLNDNSRGVTKLEIPQLKKVHTLNLSGVFADEDELGGILPLGSEIFPELKHVTVIKPPWKTENYVFTEVYPTVKTLKINCFKEENWQTIFPNLTLFQACCSDFTAFERCLILSPKIKVPFLDLCITLRHNYTTFISDIQIWNILTGNAEVDPESEFYIQGVHDQSKLSEKQIVPIMPNLRVLKVKHASLIHVGAIVFISLHHNFKTSQKLKFYITENNFQTIPKRIIQILKDNHNVIFSLLIVHIMIIKHKTLIEILYYSKDLPSDTFIYFINYNSLIILS